MSASREIIGAELLGDERLNAEGFLVLRRLRLRLRRGDGSLTREGRYDFIERPMGRDAVVIALYRPVAGGGYEVLLRDGIRVPLWFEESGGSGPPRLHTEVPAGIIEAGEEDDAGLRRRAADEALEEAGITVRPEDFRLLGAPMYATPGLCAERFLFVAAEVRDVAAGHPAGDGSPFEEGARLRWRELEAAIADCERGQIADVKTELALRRLRDRLRPATASATLL